MELCGRNILDDMERKPVPTKVQAFCFEKERKRSSAGTAGRGKRKKMIYERDDRDVYSFSVILSVQRFTIRKAFS